ncbi:unnamed protein product [Urochloa humidicola]
MSGPAPTPTPTPLPPPPATRPARYDFLNSNPPPNYVAGLGRGATGFTTRSDIGPASTAPDPGAGRGRGKAPGEDDGEEEEKGYEENQNFDEFEGNDAGLFSGADYDDDDHEADAVWEGIDQRMDSRRKEPVRPEDLTTTTSEKA